MKAIALAAVAAAGVATSPAMAVVYNLSASGTVSRTTLGIDGAYTPAPTGQFGVGDAFNVTMRFDDSKAVLAQLFDADPTVNIYYLPDLITVISSGSYSSSYASQFGTSASTQLWNNRDAVGPTDSQSFTTSNYNFIGQTPFDIGGGLNFEMLTVAGYDPTSLVRTSDLITELNASSKAFYYNSITYTYSAGPVPSGSVIRPIVIVDVGDVSWSLTPTGAVPEPATWAMMILGMGAVGVAMRHRNRAAATGRFVRM